MSGSSESHDPERLLAQADWLRGLARRLVRHADTAEDVVQDTLVAALEHGPRRDEGDERDAGLRAWMATVARNFARRRHRAAAVRRYHEELAATSRSQGGAARDELELLQTQKTLTEAILALREPYRSAVVLRHQKGLSYRALAKRLGVTPVVARKRVSRGVAQLRESLDVVHGGRRDAWCTALVVFARRPIGVVASTVTIGGITLGTKTLGIAAATGIAVLAGWSLTRDANEPIAPMPAAVVAHALERAEPALPPAEAPPDVARVALELEGPARLTGAPGVPGTPASEHMLHGRVVDEAGRAIAGATVELRRDELRGFSSLDLEHDKRGAVLATVTTDGQGLFAAEAALGHPMDLRVSHAGFADALHTGSYAGEFVEIELSSSARLTGRVVRTDGTPVAGALVKGIKPDGAFVPLFEGRTDDAGQFLFEDLQAGAVRLKVMPKEDEWLHRVSVVLEAGKTTERELTVEKGYWVTGRVVDADTGQPIAGAEVGQGWTFTKSVRTDTDGRYLLKGFATQGVYEIDARAPGYGRSEQELPSAVDNLVTADFALRRGVSARGRLVDESGQAVEGAYVGCVASPDWKSDRTGSSGRFHLADLRPDTAYCLLAIAEGFGTAAFEFPRPLLGAGEYDLGDVVVRPAASLRGRVVGTDGQPLADLPVVLVAEYEDRFVLSGPLEETTGDHYVGEREGETDQLGRFSFGDLAPGTYSLAAGDSGQHISRSEPVRVHAGEAVDGIEIVLDAGLAISGVVVDEDGEPVPGTVVLIHPEPPTEGRMAQVITGPAGRFRAEGFALGTYQMQAFPTDLDDSVGDRDLRPISLLGVDPFGGDLRIVLPSSSPISGRVVDVSGQPVLHALVVARDSEGQRVTSDFSDGSGAFSLQVAPGSVVDLTAKLPQIDGPFYLTSDTADETSTTLEGVEAGSTDLRLALPVSRER